MCICFLYEITFSTNMHDMAAFFIYKSCYREFVGNENNHGLAVKYLILYVSKVSFPIQALLTFN